MKPFDTDVKVVILVGSEQDFKERNMWSSEMENPTFYKVRDELLRLYCSHFNENRSAIARSWKIGLRTVQRWYKDL